MTGANNLTTIWFALSGFHTMHRAYNTLFLQKNPFLAFRVVISGILRCVFIFVPFIAYQAYGYYTLCDRHNPDKLRPWCKEKIPLLYNFIQSHYWGVGFLIYFQLKQLPNFLLASPILSIALCSIIHYVKLHPKAFFSLGFQVDPITTSFLESQTSTVIQEDQGLRRRKHSKQEVGPTMLFEDNVSVEKLERFSVIIIPFVLHLGFMVATASFVMHVQVATRFLSSSPLIYWFASYVLVSHKRWGYFIWSYCAAYILIGSLLFSNFYPFT